MSGLKGPVHGKSDEVVGSVPVLGSRSAGESPRAKGSVQIRSEVVVGIWEANTKRCMDNGDASRGEVPGNSWDRRR